MGCSSTTPEDPSSAGRHATELAVPSPPVRAPQVLALAVLAAGAAACGERERVNADRPPSPVNLTAAVLRDRVLLSPRTVGAGPIVLIVSNQSRRTQSVTVETQELGGRVAGVRASTGPIAPRGTGTLKVDARTGRYRVRVRDASIRPARLWVGRPRPSAQDQLLQP
jgi:hypothetical protein